MEILRIIVDAVCVLQDAQRGSVLYVLDQASIAARLKMHCENRKIKKPSVSVLRLRRDKPTAVTIEGSK